MSQFRKANGDRMTKCNETLDGFLEQETDITWKLNTVWATSVIDVTKNLIEADQRKIYFSSLLLHFFHHGEVKVEFSWAPHISVNQEAEGSEAIRPAVQYSASLPLDMYVIQLDPTYFKVPQTFHIVSPVRKEPKIQHMNL